MSGGDVIVREAREDDVDAIHEVFRAVYGADYPYKRFSDPRWLKRSIFSDDIVMLVATDVGGEVLGSASVVFDVGAHTDLIGEFGRLVVHPDARGRGVGHRLMDKRIELAKDRIHVAVVENRCVHPFSQRISAAHDFVPVGFLPLKHRFRTRESISLFVRHFGAALELRNNHPRVVPEAHNLAHFALEACRLSPDAIVDEDSAPYPSERDFEVEELTAEGMPALLRIERGRVRHREVFGPMRLQYGFFKLTARRASYLIARAAEAGPQGPVMGAIGFIQDDVEKSVRVFELIAESDHAVWFLFDALLRRAEREWGTEYVEVDVSAHAPRMQRTLLELGFLPVAYVPAMVFHEVERFDVVRMARVLVEPSFDEVRLFDRAKVPASMVMRSLSRQHVLPQVAAAVNRLELFRGLNDEQTNRVAVACTVAEHAAGARLFGEGEEAAKMHLVISGEVAVSLGGRTVGTVGAGELLGELSALTGEPHSAAATATSRVVTADLSREALRELTRRRPDVGVVLYRNLAVGLGRKLQRVDATLGDATLGG